MMKKPTIHYSSSDELFKALLSAATESNGMREVYKRYQQVLMLFLDERTAPSKLTFAGPFAKMDYLLRENNANWWIVRNANDARVRIRKSKSLSEKELSINYLFDLKALCQFFALIDGVNIPDALLQLFPKTQQHAKENKILGECMRMIVDSWDGVFVYGRIDGYLEENGSKVDYIHGSRNFPYDWSYLAKMFYKGAQLNLVRPSVNEDGTILPELIIFEPDYLVNVTSVARCFTHYADSPFVNLIHKIEPMADNQAIQLGNFAGQLLDEELYGDEWTDDVVKLNEKYNNSVKKYFQHHALSMLTTQIDSRQFHSDAKRQALNIHHALKDVLPKEKGYNSAEGIVEPSFFSEMLGIQGRMDFLQLDYRYVIEQKSGKGAPPYNDFSTPIWTEEHFIQLQLYMLLFRYNYREKLERNKFGLQPFLLYSKYTNSLLRVTNIPEEVFKAIKVRNGIAWLELNLTKPGAYRIYDSLTTVKLNMKKVDDTLWSRWQLPQIANVLSVIQNASPLEKAYFFRFMTFISNEHVMSKLGNKTKECSGFASTWYDSTESKRLAGNIFDNLKLIYPAYDTKGGIEYVDLAFADDIDNDMSNFRRGDIVILYSYDAGTEPDATKSIVIRCKISEITKDSHIILSLRHPQSDNRIFQHESGKVWAIEHDFMEASYSGLYKGMFSFLKATKSRRDLLLFQREAEVGNTRQLRGNYGAFNYLALRVKRAKDFFLIIGPPGTGKTSFGLLNTLKEELLEPDSSVLLMSYTNRAVDEICSKLKEADIDFIRIGGDATASEEYKDNLISSRLASISRLSDVKKMLIETRVYVGTTTSINSQLNLFQLKQFDLAIIDEASQILEPHLMGILSARHGDESAIRKFVMIGDHKQLPAVVQQSPEISTVSERILNDICLYDCRFSLFERLLRKYNGNKGVVYMLTKQGRMHPDIASFPNIMFYDGKLDIVPLSHQKETLPQHCDDNNGLTSLLRTRRIAFIASELPVKTPSDKVNSIEAEMIAATVVKIYELEKNNFSADDTVGVIVPYRNQISAVRKLIDKYNIDILHNITIDTVERFQGSQRRYIIYGFTIQKPYQLRFLTSDVFTDVNGTVVDRKLNVAMTRAEEHLIMIGNKTLLDEDPIFHELINFVKERSGYFEIDKSNYIKGNFNVPDL